MTKLSMFLVGLILCATLLGCESMRQTALDISLEEVENAKTTREVALNYLKSWPVFSGLIRGALGPQMQELPLQAVEAVDALDELATRVDECSDHELGYALGLKIRLLSSVVQEAIKMYAPELIEYVPLLF